jgi:hypothetical protein
MRPEDVFAQAMMEKKAEAAPPPAPPAAPAPEAPPAKTLTSRSVFSHPEAHPYALDLVLLKNFQMDWFTWLPDTLFHEIQQTFGGSLAEVNKLKIMAVQTLHVVDTFWEEWEIFEKTLWALNGQVPIVGSIQPPDLPVLFAGVDTANQVRKENFNEEVSRYCAAVFLHENVFYAPEPLSFCQDYLSDPFYVCGDCEKKSSALPPFDGMCSSCGGHYDSEHPFRFQPDPDAVRRGAGKNLKMDRTYNPDPIKARFDQFNAMAGDQLKAALQETMEDIQAAKLITAVDFMQFRETQLNEQLVSLRSWLEMQ